MPKTPLTGDSEFVVTEDKVLDYILGFLFFALFLYGSIDAIRKHFTNIQYLNYLFIISLGPALYYFTKGRSGRVYIRVNKIGIYQDEKLVTGWNNFLNAYITEKAKVLSIKDNFLLIVEYTKDGSEKGFRRKIRLTNTQNKSEEEVHAAINFFWKLHQDENEF